MKFHDSYYKLIMVLFSIAICCNLDTFTIDLVLTNRNWFGQMIYDKRIGNIGKY